MDFGRVITAMVTPFDKDGFVDYNKTTELIEHLLANGTDGLVVSGTTGESPTLLLEEKLKLFEHVQKVVDNRVPILAGTGDNSTKSSILLTKEAERLGMDGVLLVAPYYNKPSQQGLYEHFKAIAKETNLPIMLYNIPGRSVVNLEVDTVVKLSQIDNIVSLKEAGKNLDQVAEILKKVDQQFSVYSGNDNLTLPLLSIGVHGVVSVASHIIGNEIKKMIDLYINGNVTEAAAIHRDQLPIFQALFSQPSPAPVKTALEIFGIDVGGVRLPLVELTKEEKESLFNILKGTG
ncbi:4-hydroxy-tetrahydrodipicolinate synthase [Oceanobacillus piezotolerans]|uniref:4-hydroxy-tetrahydrodipicolinate synthase n=1 Tax=Oceanobacillus piezotolerans TaxID=2448030 RepID=A0A498D979_9BACI|nr:4-hydroxy-tetrahydrodipicolinate synthase [Oceanobacillus piezotolerans]RLL45367.1 4-hydroxy-tetrahydrodipicolinate synthase [Oceanobacillus piezotolerans]